MRIEQALDFIHACPPGNLSPCLTCYLLNWFRRACSGRSWALSPCAVGACPWSAVLWAIIGMSLFRHVPMAQLANQLDILLPGDRPFVVPSAFIQARQNWLTKPFDRCSSRPPHSGISSVSIPPGPGLQLLAVDGVVWRTPDTRTMPWPFAKSKPPGETQYPRSACCVRWS